MFGLKKPSLALRIAIGKLCGLVVGLAGLIALPYYYPQADWMLRIGIVFWYITVGAVIGLGGTLTWQPVVNISLPWWLRGIGYGAWFNFVLALFMYTKIAEIMQSAKFMGLVSPWWIILEGMIFGFIADGLATRYAGEGKACVEDRPES